MSFDIMDNKEYQISEVSVITGVKAGTIRFYERCGFLGKVQRLPNRYRVFTPRNICQIRICRLVFGGFVNKRLRRISMGVIEAASRWDLEAYAEAAWRYRRAVEEDIDRTKQVINIAVHHMGQGSTDKVYSKKQAADLVGVTPEAIRNWERNGLLPQGQPYKRRYYGQQELNRMYVIRFLLDAGYSIMAILRFFTEYDSEGEQKAVRLLLDPEKNEDLRHRADRYLETLQQLRTKTLALCELLEEMKKNLNFAFVHHLLLHRYNHDESDLKQQERWYFHEIFSGELKGTTHPAWLYAHAAAVSG